MGAVIEMGDRAEVRTNESAGKKLPRRTTALRDRAPVVLDEATQRIGTSVTVEGKPAQATVLRRHLRTVACLPEGEMATVESLASELFNNAVTHTESGAAGGTVVVTVVKLLGRTQVKVTDAGTRSDGPTPHVRPCALDRAGGFGLRLVDVESSRWGTVHEDGRTTVWFEIDRPQK